MTPPIFRRDPIGGWWTILSPGRDDRPVDAALQSADGSGAFRGGPGRPASNETAPHLSRGSACPFCPGEEDELEEVLEELPGPDGWRARAVRNRWPFVARPASPSDDASAGPPHEARGTQEVLIECRRHLRGFADLSGPERRGAVELWWRRMRAGDAPGVRSCLFRNEGRDAGASREHPHAQIVRLLPPSAGSEALPGRRPLLSDGGECALCDSGAAEEGERAVVRTAHFRVVTVAAPLDPYHLRIVPLRHHAHFAGCRPEELDDLAAVVGGVARALRAVAGDPAWNLLVHDLGPGEGPGLHWHVEVRPRFARTAGFELATGVGVCALLPEVAADRLRRFFDTHPPTESERR